MQVKTINPMTLFSITWIKLHTYVCLRITFKFINFTLRIFNPDLFSNLLLEVTLELMYVCNYVCMYVILINYINVNHIFLRRTNN